MKSDGPGSTDADRATAILREVQTVDCRLGVRIVAHFDDSAASAQAGLRVFCNFN